MSIEQDFVYWEGEELDLREPFFDDRFAWQVWRDGYCIDNGLIQKVKSSCGWETIYPLEDGDDFLLQRFLEIVDEASLLRFSNQYGTLQPLFQIKALERMSPEERPLFIVSGAICEASLLRSLLALHKAGASPDESRLDELRSLVSFPIFNKLRDSGEITFMFQHAKGTVTNLFHTGSSMARKLIFNEDGVWPEGEIAWASGGATVPGEIDHQQNEDWALLARLFSAEILNLRLRKHPSVFQITPRFPEGPLPHVRPKDLISAIWWQAYRYMTGISSVDGNSKKVVECVSCGKFGEVPHVAWSRVEKGFEKGKWRHKACANRSRVAASTARKKAKEAAEAPVKHCPDCGIVLETGKKGRPPLRCPKCAKKYANRDKKYPSSRKGS